MPETLSVAEAASLAGVSQASIYNWVKENKVAAWKRNGVTVVSRADVERVRMAFDGPLNDRAKKIEAAS